MASIDIPAHSRMWYEDNHMAPRLASDGIRERKTRSSKRVHKSPLLCSRMGRTFDGGWATGPGQGTRRKQWTAALVEKWLWNDALNGVHGFQSPPHKTAGGLNENYPDNASVTYTCSVIDDVLHCPD
jgi:hypothetical protein